MKIVVFVLAAISTLVGRASKVEWKDMRVLMSTVIGEQKYCREYDMVGHVKNERALCSVEGTLLGYRNDDGFYLKQAGFTPLEDPTLPTYVVSSTDNNVLVFVVLRGIAERCFP